MKSGEKRPYQCDMELCVGSPCWRFKKDAPICVNCPWKGKLTGGKQTK